MDWQLTSLIVGMVIAVMGGITGFFSTLLPLLKSRTKLKVIIPYNEGTLYRDEIYHTTFDEQTMQNLAALDFPIALSSDICILNLSSRKLAIYSIRLTCIDKNSVEHEFYLSKISEGGSKYNPSPLFVRESYCELPLEIEPDCAKLVSVKFQLGEVVLMNNFTIHVDCQDKSFNSVLLVRDYSDIENYL